MGIRKKKTFIEQAADYVDQVRPHVEQALETAKDQARPLLDDARDKAAPIITDARDRAMPKINEARDRARPLIADGAALAAERAAQVADLAAQKAAESRDLAASKVAEIKGEPEPKKGGKLKKIALLGILAGVAAFVAGKLKGGQESQNWQSSYTPAPPPAPSSATPPTPAAPAAGAAVGEDEGDDTAGSSPDEALADAAETPHSATTPDDPAEEVSIDEGGAHRA